MHPDDTTKRCSKCGEIKPRDQFSKQKPPRTALRADCKQCRAARTLVYRETHPDKRQQQRDRDRVIARNAPPATDKRCTACGETKPLAAFSKARAYKDGLNIYCRACMHVRSHAYYLAHKDEVREKLAEWGRNHPENRRATHRRYHRTHPDRSQAAKARFQQQQPNYHAEHYQANKQRYRAMSTAWNARIMREHPEKLRERGARRRALVRGTRIERVSYEAIWIRDGGVCHICGDPVERTDVHFDHVIPLSKGGPHTYENIKVSHSLCNWRKGTKLLD